MSAPVAPAIPIAPYRLRLEAVRKGERVRELADELAAFQAGEPRSYMVGYYEGQGWADAHDLLLAVETLREEGR